MTNSLLEINYTKETVQILLEHYRKIQNEPQFRYLLLDLDNALCSDYLTGEQRRILFVRYNLELNITQTLQLLNLDYKTYINLLDTALALLAQECDTFTLHSEDVVAPQPFASLFGELEHRTANIFSLECTDAAHVLYKLGDTLIYNAIGLTIDTREYTDNISKNSKYIYRTKDFGGRKNATEDEFYRQDLKNNVFYGDESLVIAELDKLGSVYY